MANLHVESRELGGTEGPARSRRETPATPRARRRRAPTRRSRGDCARRGLATSGWHSRRRSGEWLARPSPKCGPRQSRCRVGRHRRHS